MNENICTRTGNRGNKDEYSPNGRKCLKGTGIGLKPQLLKASIVGFSDASQTTLSCDSDSDSDNDSDSDSVSVWSGRVANNMTARIANTKNK
jgi:hypothetical protein